MNDSGSRDHHGTLNPQRNHLFDLLRIIFSILVLLAHASELTAHPEIFTRLTHSGVTFGGFAVDGFFLLSGFLIVQSWEHDPDGKNFLRKRVLRIVPGYLIAAVLSTLIAGLVAPGIEHFFLHLNWKFPLSILCLSDPVTPPVFPGLPQGQVNGSLWTIGYEFRCYLLVLLWGLTGLLRRRIVCLALTMLLLAAVLIPAMAGAFHWTHAILILGDAIQDLRLTTVYAMGACFYLFRKTIAYRPSICALLVVALLISIRLRFQGFETVLVLTAGYFMFYAGRMPITALGWMKRVPDISYGIYLYGWPVESLWIWYHRGSPWTAFSVSTIFCSVLGWLSWHFVEKPMLRFKRNAEIRSGTTITNV